MIVEVDSSILKRKDMHMAVSQKFLDTSISVREAAVDLVGKYVLSSPELINQYYEKLAERILVCELKNALSIKFLLNLFFLYFRTLVSLLEKE